MVTVTILLSSRTAKEDGEGIRGFSHFDELKGLGVEFIQNDPDAGNDELQRYFSVEMESERKAQELIDKLLGMEAVEAAYIKPRDEPPA